MAESKHSQEEKSTSPKNNFEALSDIVTSHLDLDFQNEERSTVSGQSRVDHQTLPFLKLLKPIPWILFSGFIFSFYWDFNGFGTAVWGFTLTFDGLLRIVTVSGMIGFLTNWIAITMLFRPLQKRPLLGQGLIPSQKERIARRLALAVSEDLINPKIIKKKINSSKAVSRFREQALRHVQSVTQKKEFRSDLKEWILDYISSLVQDPEFKEKVSGYILDELEDSLQDKVVERIALKTYSLFRGQSLQSFIEDLISGIPISAERNIEAIDEYLDDLPSIISRNSEKIDDLITQALYKLINQLNVETLVEENLKAYDEQKLENMIRRSTNEQLKTIQYLGAVLGTIGGFVIWEPLLSLGLLTVLFGTVYLLDRQLYR